MILRLRILLIVAGVVAFTYAMRTGIDWVRWAAIGLVGVGLLLRFIKPRS